MRWSSILLLALFAGVAVYYWSSNYVWRQKLTVEVETPEGTKTASSVSRVTARKSNFVPGFPGGRVSTGFRGEAVVLELLPGKYLFALVDDLTFMAAEVFAEELGRKNKPGLRPTFEEWAEKLSTMRGTRAIPEKHYPLLVTFTDINDPTTVKQVDPNDLEASFGPGVRLRRIKITITDEPVTEGRVEEVLGWLDNLEAYRTVPDNPFTSTLPREIGYLRGK